MKKYRYEAIDQSGKHVDGVLKSETFENVVAHILMTGMYPTYIEELSGSKLIAHGRLSKLKEIRNRLEKRDDLPTVPQPVLPPRRDRLPTLFLLAFLLAWLAMVAVYLVYNSLDK